MNNCILVIEDNLEMQDLIKILLEQEGYNIISATSGNAALEALSAKPDLILILLDLTLPDFSADALLSKMKTEKLGCNVPIVYFSAVARLNQMKLPSGVVGIIQKPFQIQDFLNSISRFRQYQPGLKKILHPELNQTANKVG